MFKNGIKVIRSKVRWQLNFSKTTCFQTEYEKFFILNCKAKYLQRLHLCSIEDLRNTEIVTHLVLE